jgi:hypothetical protein
VEKEDGAVRITWTRSRIGRNPPPGKLRCSCAGVVKADGVVFHSGRSGSGGDRSRGMKDDLPLALVEEQAEGEVGAGDSKGHDAEHGVYEPASTDERLLRGEGIFPAGRRLAGGLPLSFSLSRCAGLCVGFFAALIRRLGWHALTESQFVGGFKGCTANATDDGRAVSADERVEDDPGAVGAPELGWVLRLRGGGFCFGVHH